ncbi:MAG: hypothetical protein O7C75_02370, partial [Verrucomicrobia bacterium]|nr:hypothetical protein [Verrucomicrobiota bacterium]
DTTGTLSESGGNFVVLPLAGINAEYAFTNLLRLGINAAGIHLSSDKVLDAGAAIWFHFDRHWEAAVGYQFYGQEIDTEEVFNRMNYDIVYLAVAHTF